MLNTLLKIGKWQQSKSDEWRRHLDEPKVQFEDNNGNLIKNYIVPLIFDLDRNEIYSDSDFTEYKEEHIYEYKLLRVQGGNVKGYYSSVVPKKLNILLKTYFGDIESETSNGQLLSLIESKYNDIVGNDFIDLLKSIYDLKNKYIIKNKISQQDIIKIELNGNEKIAFIYACIKSKLLYGDDIKPIAKIDSYINFLKEKLEINKGSKNQNKDNTKICYASGNVDSDIREMNLTAKYSLNKMFVTTTQNYLNDYKKNSSNRNYQVSKINQEKLDLASSYLLNNNKVKIANIDHVIIPQFLSIINIDFDLVLEGIKRKSDILFSPNALRTMTENIQFETNSLFWLNFIAFESDGNFFKTTNLIKDVSEFHFNKVINTFCEVDSEFRYSSDFVNWDSVMTEYGNTGLFFNFNTVYKLIPIRKEKEKKNVALILFKMILENRKIEFNSIFKYFSDLALCHYYERYKSFTNVNISNKEYFRKSIRDNVFKYLAFLKVLRKLNLIIMINENIENIADGKPGNKYEVAINNFFKKMEYNSSQKALFYLGRMLNTVDYIQRDKNKTVIDKVNYNGMEKDDIVRLRISLVEKAKQYGKINYIVFDDAKFTEYFDFNNWKVDSKEALFFIMTGFSFGAKSKDENNNENEQ